MKDYYLKFQSEAESIEVLCDFDVSIDVIGVIYKTSDPSNEVFEQIDGWHVNVRANNPSKILEKYSIVVKTPIRVWA
jgi:hypothetical protein